MPAPVALYWYILQVVIIKIQEFGAITPSMFARFEARDLCGETAVNSRKYGF